MERGEEYSEQRYVVKEYKKGGLESSTQTEDQMKSGLLLDVVIRKGTTVFQLLSSEDQTLLIWILDGVRGLHVQCNSLSGKRLHKDLHDSIKIK